MPKKRVVWLHGTCTCYTPLYLRIYSKICFSWHGWFFSMMPFEFRWTHSGKVKIKTAFESTRQRVIYGFAGNHSHTLSAKVKREIWFRRKDDPTTIKGDILTKRFELPCAFRKIQSSFSWRNKLSSEISRSFILGHGSALHENVWICKFFFMNDRLFINIIFLQLTIFPKFTENLFFWNIWFDFTFTNLLWAIQL